MFVLMLLSSLGLAQQQVARPYNDRVRIVADDALLVYFLNEFTAAVEYQSWPVVVTFFEEEPYRIQTREFGISDAQFIREAILAPGDQSLPRRPGDASEFARLNSIDTITITTVEFGGLGDVTIGGQVTLYDGTTRRVQFGLVRKVTGEYEITSAVG